MEGEVPLADEVGKIVERNPLLTLKAKHRAKRERAVSDIAQRKAAYKQEVERLKFLVDLEDVRMAYIGMVNDQVSGDVVVRTTYGSKGLSEVLAAADSIKAKPGYVEGTYVVSLEAVNN